MATWQQSTDEAKGAREQHDLVYALPLYSSNEIGENVVRRLIDKNAFEPGKVDASVISTATNTGVAEDLKGTANLERQEISHDTLPDVFSLYSWLAVDPWEVTRRRIMDYMSVLEHAKEVCHETFPGHAGDITILYMCQASQVTTGKLSPVVFLITRSKMNVKFPVPEKYLHTSGAPSPVLQIHHLNPAMLRAGGFGVIIVCRPLEKERLLKELSPSFRNIAILVEDSAILSAELDTTSSTMVRGSHRRKKVQ